MKKTVMILCAAVLVSLTGCKNEQPAKYDSVNVEEFAEVINDSDVVLIDVRGAEKFDEGHIDGAENMSVNDKDFEKDVEAKLPKNKTIAVYCNRGNNSKKAAEILAKKGYKVVELKDGYNEWKKAENGLTLVDFYATWCGPCKKMHPVLDELKKQLGDKIHIVKYDVDKEKELADKYEIQSVPTLMIMVNGEVKWRESGAMSLEELTEIVNKFAK